MSVMRTFVLSQVLLLFGVSNGQIPSMEAQLDLGIANRVAPASFAPSSDTDSHSAFDPVAARRLMGDMGVDDKQCNQYISLGGFHTCAVAAGGTGRCWGKNNFGQATVPTGIGVLHYISAGWHHSCAINTTGTVHCWGRTTFYMRGAQFVPPDIKASKIRAVSAGYDHTCVILFNTGEPRCWGWGSELTGTDGYPFNSRYTRDGGHKQAIPDPSGTMQDIIPDAATMQVTQISAGRYHTCAVKVDGSGVCFGRNDYYQAEVPSNVMVGNIQRDVGDIVGVSSGTYHTCAVRSEGKRGVCWGYNMYGQVLYPQSGINLPYDAEDLKMISSGEAHSCAIRENGSVICWGWNHYKQADPVPTHQAVLLGTGDFHSCSADSAGALLCWGWNNFGQCAVPSNLTVEVGSCT